MNRNDNYTFCEGKSQYICNKKKVQGQYPKPNIRNPDTNRIQKSYPWYEYPWPHSWAKNTLCDAHAFPGIRVLRAFPGVRVFYMNGVNVFYIFYIAYLFC